MGIARREGTDYIAIYETIVAQINGWRFHTDGVHLNSRSGLIVADLVQKFIEK